MSQTVRGSYVFAVKEHADGTPWILLEPSGGDLEILKEGFLGFDLPEGTNVREAERIALYMRENLGHLSFTSF